MHNVHLIIFFVEFASTFILTAQFGTVIVQSFVRAQKKYDSIFVNK